MNHSLNTALVMHSIASEHGKTIPSVEESLNAHAEAHVAVMDQRIIRGVDAINSLVSAYRDADRAEIVEHSCGIDVDNAGRFYDHDSVTDYQRMLWYVMLYVPQAMSMPEGYTVDDLFSAKVKNLNEPGELLLSFSVHHDIFDSESRGTHFEFRYA